MILAEVLTARGQTRDAVEIVSAFAACRERSGWSLQYVLVDPRFELLRAPRPIVPDERAFTTRPAGVARVPPGIRIPVYMPLGHMVPRFPRAPRGAARPT